MQGINTCSQNPQARSGSVTPHETEHDGSGFTFVHTRGGSDGAEVAVADHLKPITVKSIEVGDSLKFSNTQTRLDRCCCYGNKSCLTILTSKEKLNQLPSRCLGDKTERSFF